ncbi:hypothetical protein [Bizionia myxarmorum]|uniref:Tetratricopeptide repeat protein n=1 Tax=Bizionia myxarmorum TaxID=291186 RepID=A0A5D0R990_9FLAO|nr:hypothetical protein [Bizionia myxarmorum]TYB78220.1 hypothetical protein ES674_00115 [Bizionia myxarmorum]
MITAAEFSKIIQQPQHITANQTSQIKEVLEAFPYFQSARASYLKGLKNRASVKYNHELKVTAAYTTDRSILFDFITSEAFLQNEISQHIKQHLDHIKSMDVDSEDISVDKRQRDDAILKQQITDTEGTLDPELFQPKFSRPPIAHFQLDEKLPVETVFTVDETEGDSKTVDITEVTETPDGILKIGQPLQFDHQEKHSFNEWLMLARFDPIERKKEEEVSKKKDEKSTEEADKSEIERHKKFDLIDQFISNNPKLKPNKTPVKNTNIADAQMIQPEALMTETLARIYLEQKNYKKAIQSYNILSLKYPEKSGFFADQIKAVKQLQEQNNE